MDASQLVVRQPTADDGYAIYQLIQRCPPLDLNSAYLYLLQSTHFASTCLLVEYDGQVEGFVSGYLHPQQADTFFLWQVAIGEKLRGQGYARRLIEQLLQQPALAKTRFLDTTITPDNAASWALFRALAREQGAPLTESVMFSQQQLGGEHLAEHLVRIGPWAEKT